MKSFEMTEYLTGSKDNNIFLLAGPCVIEGEEMAMHIAEKAVEITSALNIPYVFKGSYRKANRSRLDSFTGIGDEKALKILRKIRESFEIPVVTDIHSKEEADVAAEYVDILQIPAFLCRQTDLLLAAAATGKCVNIKKGQFISPSSMRLAVEKARAGGCSYPLVTERGTFFGYQDLVVDMRSFPIMKRECGCLTVIDATHSLQQPNQSSGVTGGNPELISTIALSAVSAGADGVFIETHEDPGNARSDGANMLPLCELKNLLTQLSVIRRAVNEIRKYEN